MASKISFKNKLKSYSAIVSVGLLLSGAYAADLPTGGVVKSGSATISSTDNTMIIKQSTDKAIIDWNTFSVAAGQTVEFQQPSSTSATLNRVTSNTPSTIAGQIKANGQVFLINPNGILFTKSGSVNTAAFSASTLDMQNADFLSGKYLFTQSNAKGTAVVNKGSITVSDGGFIALLGNAIQNDGTVFARLGKIAFGAGQKMLLTFGENDLLTVEVSAKELLDIRDTNGKKLTDAISSDGKIIADGGIVQLNTAVVRGLLRKVISIGGSIQANSVRQKAGKIRLSGDVINITGTIDVSGNINGGNINIHARKDLTSSANIDASGKTGFGGRINISAVKSVNITSGKISATGHNRGGLVRIGGAFRGGASSKDLNAKAMDLFIGRWGRLDKIASSKFTFISSGTKIDVSSSHDVGGTVIVWSDKTTNFFGAINAQGASGKAFGGSVELSGKVKLITGSLNDVHIGKAGVLLLDPKNITLTTGGTINAIQTKLGQNTDVILVASNDITLTNVLTATGTGILTLMAGRSIIINANLSVAGGVVLIANMTSFSSTTTSGISGITSDIPSASDRDNGIAKITMASGISITSSGGDVKITMQYGNTGNGDIKRYSGIITLHTVTGNRVSIRHLGTKFDPSDTATSKNQVKILSGGVITANKTITGVADKETLEIVADTFHSASGASALTVNSSARYLVWLKSSTGNQYGASGTKITGYGFTKYGMTHNGTHWNKAGVTVSGKAISDTGSAFLFKKVITITGTGSGGDKTKVYDGTATHNGAKATFTATAIAGLTITLDTSSSTAKYIGASSKTDEKSVLLAKRIKYSAITATATDSNSKPAFGLTTSSFIINGATITKKALTVGATATGRAYDGTTAVASTGITYSGLVNGETTKTGATLTGTMTDKNAGSGKTVTFSALANADKDSFKISNYQITYTAGTVAIAKKALTVGATATGRAYDGTTAVASTGITYSGLVNGETTKTGATLTGTMTDKNAGSGKTVTFSALANADKDSFKISNYQITYTAGTVAIAKKALTVGATATGRAYDGTTAVASTGITYSGLVNGETAKTGATLTGTMTDKNAGSGKTVTFSALANADKDSFKISNYQITYTAGTVAIAKKALTVGATATGRAYDGTTAVASTGITYSGLVNGETTKTGATLTGTMTDKNAGSGKTVTFSALANADKDSFKISNYQITYTAGTVAIAKKALTVGATATGRAYDGTTAVASTGITYSGLVNGETTKTGATLTGTMTDKNAGSGKTVTFSALANADKDSFKISNYQITYTAGTVAIAKKALTVGATATGRAYDGTTAVASTGITYSGLVNGETAKTGATLTGTMTDKNAGSGKTVTFSALANADKDSFKISNYQITYTAGTVAIAKKALTVSGSEFKVASKTYDGNITATATFKQDKDGFTDGGVLNNDKVTFAMTANSFVYGNKNAGYAKQVNYGTKSSLIGNDAGNYDLIWTVGNIVNGLTGDITNVKPLPPVSGNDVGNDDATSGSDGDDGVSVEGTSDKFNKNKIDDSSDAKSKEVKTQETKTKEVKTKVKKTKVKETKAKETKVKIDVIVKNLTLSYGKTVNSMDEFMTSSNVTTSEKIEINKIKVELEKSIIVMEKIISSKSLDVSKVSDAKKNIEKIQEKWEKLKKNLKKKT